MSDLEYWRERCSELEERRDVLRWRVIDLEKALQAIAALDGPSVGLRDRHVSLAREALGGV